MSWDVFIQNLPPEARRVADVPDDFRPAPLGTRSEVMARILDRFPDIDFSDSNWGKLRREDFSVDIALMGEGEINAITLHVRGGDGAVYAVTHLIEAAGGRAVDSWTGELFDPEVGLHSIRRWRAYLEE